jgi:hypothetical protein
MGSRRHDISGPAWRGCRLQVLDTDSAKGWRSVSQLVIG